MPEVSEQKSGKYARCAVPPVSEQQPSKKVVPDVPCHGCPSKSGQKLCARCAVLRASKQTWAKMMCQMCRAPGFEANVSNNVVPDVPCSGLGSKRSYKISQYVPCRRFRSKSRENMPDVPCHQFRSNNHQKKLCQMCRATGVRAKVGKNCVPDVPCSGLRSKRGQK